MQIKNYTCDLCGTIIINLADTEEIAMRCTAENYDHKFKYTVCPYCASVFKHVDNDKAENLLLNCVQRMVGKYEQ